MTAGDTMWVGRSGLVPVVVKCFGGDGSVSVELPTGERVPVAREVLFTCPEQARYWLGAADECAKLRARVAELEARP